MLRIFQTDSEQSMQHFECMAAINFVCGHPAVAIIWNIVYIHLFTVDFS